MLQFPVHCLGCFFPFYALDGGPLFFLERFARREVHELTIPAIPISLHSVLLLPIGSSTSNLELIVLMDFLISFMLEYFLFPHNEPSGIVAQQNHEPCLPGPYH
ncbi:hypothetical protein VTN49DRAFT_1843 [Thermomyces lanuginosus]|uniref:uncharacterized protein n=1 Tax=Thermomyces lanuginosus TaxID=5541 RepID=UPI0037440AAD